MNENAYDAKSVGISILKSLEGKSIAETTLQRKFQVVSMASKSGVKVGDDVIHIDQQLLFQRLTVTERPPRCFQLIDELSSDYISLEQITEKNLQKTP